MPGEPAQSRTDAVVSRFAVALDREDYPAAAALLVNRRHFEALGGFDEGFYPAWHEDVDFAARTAAAGGRFGLDQNPWRRRTGLFSKTDS